MPRRRRWVFATRPGGEAGAEVPHLVHPRLELDVVRHAPFERDRVVLGTPRRLARSTRVAALAVLDHLGGPLERRHLAHPGHVAPVPLDPKLEVLIRVE